jgi:hypothetical protein
MEKARGINKVYELILHFGLKNHVKVGSGRKYFEVMNNWGKMNCTYHWI